MVKVNRAKVITIEPAQNALIVKGVAKLFSLGFEQVHGLNRLMSLW